MGGHAWTDRGRRTRCHRVQGTREHSHPGGATFVAGLSGGESCTARPTGSCSDLPGARVFVAIPFMRGREHWLRTLATGALALVMAFGFTAVYHAGYSEFRSGKIGTPIRGTAFWVSPTLLTLNPLGAPIAHIGLHVSAVIHGFRRTPSYRHTILG